MKLNLKSLRKRPVPLTWLLPFSKYAATTLYPHVYVSKEVYASLTGSEPEPRFIALLMHEQEHLNRIKKYGVAKWYFHYFYSRSFRFKEELAGTATQLRYIKRYGLEPYLERRARALAGIMYLWSTDYETALVELKRIWNNL